MRGKQKFLAHKGLISDIVLQYSICGWQRKCEMLQMVACFFRLLLPLHLSAIIIRSTFTWSPWAKRRRHVRTPRPPRPRCSAWGGGPGPRQSSPGRTPRPHSSPSGLQRHRRRHPSTTLWRLIGMRKLKRLRRMRAAMRRRRRRLDKCPLLLK